MGRIATLSLVLLSLASASGAESPELRAAKKAHVDRYWQECTAAHKGATTICADYVRALEARERKTFKRIAAATTDTNRLQVSEGIGGCYSPKHTYKDLVQCWELFAGELEQTDE